MKTINSFRSKLFALTLALMASVSSFAYDEMPDFQVDGLYYNFLEEDNVEVTHPYIPVVPVENVASNTKKKSHAISADDYYNLTNLVIPSTVTYEGKVYNVTRIGFDAFNQCDKLTFVDIPSSVKTIGGGAFYFCSSLTSITLKEGLEHIEWYAFENCRSLENITFPNSLKTIGNYAFSNTLWYKNHPNGAVYAGNVFYKYKGDIPQNTSFVIKEGTVSISPYAFVKENYHEDYSLVSVSIPNSVEVIGEGAFYRCRALTSIVIPDGVTTIETLAFHYCKALKSVTCEAVNPPALSGSVFLSTPIADATLYVPAESIEAYKTATEWKDFGQILPIEPTSYKSQWCDTWNVLELKYRYSSYTTKEDFETWRYYLAQDTLINNYTYTAVTRQTTKVPEGVYPFTIPEPEYVAAVRFTDDRKVYIYYDNTEYLLYDFNVQPGDELTVFAGINHYHSHHTNTIRVDEVFGTEISLSVFPDFYGDERPACFGVTKWVEGVGDLCGFITGADCGLSEYQTALLCAYKDGYTEYTTEYEEYAEYGCEYNSGENKEYILTLPGLQRTVCNEYCGETEEDNSANFTYKQTFDSIFFEDDKPYILCNGYLLREEDNKIFLYSQSLNKDIVLYDFTLEVGDSLPTYIKDFDGTMYSDDTLVVTDISSVTLLDGKEYKKWTFDNGMEYVEGIGMYGGHRNGNFFGLIQEIVVPCHTGTHLVCVSKNNKLLYQMDEAEMERLGAECLCEYNSGPKKDNAKNGKIGGRPTPTQWNMLEVETKEMDGTPTILRAETFSYTLENDSLVANNKTFYQLARQSTKDTAITKSFVGALHFGEDEDNRVYFLRDGHEYVLYDFTAEPGDTIEIFAGINNYPQETTYTHVVTGKDTLENGACRMMLEVVFPEEIGSDLEQQHLQKVWLAGLGSIDGIVHNAAKRTSDVHAAPSRTAHSSETQTSVMLCAWREDSCLYTTNHPEYDTFGCVYNQDPTEVENLTSPSSYQKIIHEGTLLILHEGKVYNVIGIQIK